MTCFCTNVRGSQYYLSIQSCEPLLLAHCTFSLLAASRRRSRSFTAGQRRTLSFRQKHVQGFSLPWRVCSVPTSPWEPFCTLTEFRLPPQIFTKGQSFFFTFLNMCHCQPLQKNLCAPQRTLNLPPTHSRSQISTRWCYESVTWISSDSLLSSPCGAGCENLVQKFFLPSSSSWFAAATY